LEEQAMSAFDSLGKSIGEVIDERMSSPLISSFVLAWTMINYKFFVILFSETSVKQTFQLIQEISFPDTKSWMLNGFLYPLAAAAFYLFILPKPSQFVYEHWRKLQKWKNDTNYKYDSEAYETLAKSRAQRERINELSEELKNLNADVEQLRTDAKDRIREISELKARPAGEEVDSLKDLLLNATEERDRHKNEIDQLRSELIQQKEKHTIESSQLAQTLEQRQSERAKLQQRLSEIQNDRTKIQQQLVDTETDLKNTQSTLNAMKGQHNNALTELAELRKSALEDKETNNQNLTAKEKIARKLIKEELVESTFDANQLTVLQGLAAHRGATTGFLYQTIELSPVHIDYCLVELVNQGLLETTQENEFDDQSYLLTQLGRRVYVRSDALASTNLET
jgi:hypothetical protein